MHDFAVEFSEIEAGDAVVGVGIDAVGLCVKSVLVAFEWKARDVQHTFIFSVVL